MRGSSGYSLKRKPKKLKLSAEKQVPPEALPSTTKPCNGWWAGYVEADLNG